MNGKEEMGNLSEADLMFGMRREKTRLTLLYSKFSSSCVKKI